MSVLANITYVLGMSSNKLDFLLRKHVRCYINYVYLLQIME